MHSATGQLVSVPASDGVRNARLANFHPLPKGLGRDRRYRKLSLAAARLLVDAHMAADEAESDGVVDIGEFGSLASLAGIASDATPGLIEELAVAGFLACASGGGYVLSDFRGLAHDAREASREAARERQRKHRKPQRDYQQSQRDNPRDNRRESQPPEGETEIEIERGGILPPLTPPVGPTSDVGPAGKSRRRRRGELSERSRSPVPAGEPGWNMEQVR